MPTNVTKTSAAVHTTKLAVASVSSFSSVFQQNQKEEKHSGCLLTDVVTLI